MKPGVVLVLARFYDLLPAADVRRWRGLWPAALLVLVPFALILIQPDLGTATMVLVGGVTVVFVAGLPMWYFLSAAGLAAAALPVVLTMMHDYQRKRVLIFLDPEADPLGAGYHISQSKIAIGSGGIWGKGYLNGSQSHLDYLPEGHTDFVFATFVEEWGLVGGVLLIVAFAMKNFLNSSAIAQPRPGWLSCTKRVCSPFPWKATFSLTSSFRPLKSKPRIASINGSSRKAHCSRGIEKVPMLMSGAFSCGVAAPSGPSRRWL